MLGSSTFIRHSDVQRTDVINLGDTQLDTRREVRDVDRQIQPETRKPARGGLLEVFRRLSETGLNSYLVEPGAL